MSEGILANLIFLAKRSRESSNVSELRFLLVNETNSLISFRQAAYWEVGKGVLTVSGVTTIEKNAPYIQWLEEWFRTDIKRNHSVGATSVDLVNLEATNNSWREWLPRYVVTVDIKNKDKFPGARLLLARESPFQKEDIEILKEWCDAWRDQYALRYKRSIWQLLGLRGQSRIRSFITRLTMLIIFIAVCNFPVNLNVLAPAELVAIRPTVVRAPMDGVVEQILVDPNQRVGIGDPLIQFDQVALQSKLEIAARNLITAETEYRQAAQRALFDRDSKARLNILQSRIKERKIEFDYLQELNERSTVLSASDGLAVFDNPNDWSGRPVLTGERILMIANEEKVEVEAWLSPSDMIEFAENAPVRVYLNAEPTNPVDANLSYLSYQPELRPDGLYAYRLRANILESSWHPRLGLKGTARIEGNKVKLIYLIMRRPISSFRAWLGV